MLNSVRSILLLWQNFIMTCETRFEFRVLDSSEFQARTWRPRRQSPQATLHRPDLWSASLLFPSLSPSDTRKGLIHTCVLFQLNIQALFISTIKAALSHLLGLRHTHASGTPLLQEDRWRGLNGSWMFGMLDSPWVEWI